MNKRLKFNQDQLSLPFGQKTARALSLEDRQKAFWFLVSASLCCVLVYIYAMNAAAHNIAVRQNLEREVSETNARLSTLEFASIELRNSVTIETARTYGFTEISEPLYVSRSAPSALTLNTPAR